MFSTKYQPSHPLFEDWLPWQGIKEKYFGYHHDLTPEEIAHRLGGTIVFSKNADGQWMAVIALERNQDAALGTPHNPVSGGIEVVR